MNKKKRAMAFVIALFLLVAVEVVYIFSELYNENNKPKEPVITDATKFKEEYEKLNGTTSYGFEVRNLTIDEENPFIYATEDEIVERINNKETFVVYFGFSSCPWCRSVITPLIEAAKENKVEKIYYVDVLNIRDKYELDENNKAVRTVEGTEGYYKLLESLDSVLDDYAPLTYKNKKGKEKKVKINEKRIYAPNVVAIKNGVPMALETGMIKSLNDPYMDITESMSCEMKETFKCLFDAVKDDKETCNISAQKC